MSNASNQRRLGNGSAVDHISSLPDAIIAHILSFMPTNSAVKTSILSKRWRFMWTKVPMLDFTTKLTSTEPVNLTLQQKVCFRSFINMVLLHNNVSCIQRLRLHFPAEYDNFCMKSWMVALAWREIHQIEMKMIGWNHRIYEPLSLPKKLLTCEKLVVLKLEGSFDVDVLKSLHFPSLETLHLGTHFPVGELMRRLSSGCPILKELRIDCHDAGTLYVEFLTLETLQVVGVEVEGWIIIRAPNLRSLYLDGPLMQYDFCDLCSLVEARLNIYVLGLHDPDFLQDAPKLLERVSGVKRLWLMNSFPFILVSQLPTFRNLNWLRLDKFDEDAHRMMKCAPILKCLIFRCVSFVWENSSQCESELECLPCLENVEIGWFTGNDTEMRWVGYILKAASALKEMKIQLLVRREEEREIFQKLLMLPRSSVSSQVKVSSREMLRN